MQILLLNCFILSNDLKSMFTVKIEKTKNVSILKCLIKEENLSSLENVNVISTFQMSLSPSCSMTLDKRMLTSMSA